MVDIPWGELLSCLPSPNGGEDGESRQKPRGLKKGVPPFPQVCLLDFDFQYGHVGFCMMWRFLLWSFHGRSTKTFGVSFSWYYRHIYMSWYPNRYMIYTYGLFWYYTYISMFAMRRWWTVWFFRGRCSCFCPLLNKILATPLFSIAFFICWNGSHFCLWGCSWR